MREPYIEGVAIHDDPESCAVVGNDAGEALTGARAGWVLSREISEFRAPRALRSPKATRAGRASASDWSALRGRRPHAHADPDKTRLISFGLFAAERRVERRLKGGPETFNFLGFTHICAKTKSGKFLLVRRTMRQRMRATLKAVKEALMRRRHLPIPIQGAWLGRVVRGYLAYHAVPTNVRAIQAFRTQVERHWKHALSRRSQRGRPTWATMRQLSQRWIPKPRVQHPWPDERYDVKTRGRSRVR